MSNPIITEDLLRTLVNFDEAESHVKATLARLKTDGEVHVGQNFTRFLRQYTAWNCYFAGGVAGLVSNISNATGLFTEPGFPRAIADRSILIASFFFDAARDEYDDHINPGRDPHRSLAQATLKATAEHFDSAYMLDEKEPQWLQNLCHTVRERYVGKYMPLYQRVSPVSNVTDAIFFGIGYHLGSEVLADREFTILDAYMRVYEPELFDVLKHTKVNIGGVDHRAYAWIGVHSGNDGGAEADHFAWALEGTNLALDIVDDDQARCVAVIKDGFRAFADDHRVFFTQGVK